MSDEMLATLAAHRIESKKHLACYQRIVGAIIILHQDLSESLSRLAWSVVRADPSQLEAMMSMVKEFEAKIDIASQLINMRFSNKSSHRHAKIRKTMARLHARLDKINGVRNDLVHGIWRGYGKTGIHLIRILPRTSEYKWKLKNISHETLMETETEMRRLRSEIWKLGSSITQINAEESSAKRIAK